MEPSFVSAKQCFVQKTPEEEEEIEKIYEEYKQIMETLPKEVNWIDSKLHFYQFKGFWFSPNRNLLGVMYMQDHFKPRPDDVYLSTTPKAGTTWFKALLFSIVNRSKYDFNNHPLHSNNPHECVPFLEFHLFKHPPIGDAEVLPSPRVLGTHLPYTLLPQNVINSGCKFVYVCRNPKDVFVSLWNFLPKFAGNEPLAVTREVAFDKFCEGKSMFGPFWDHVLGYWEASEASPEQILLFKYEEMCQKPLENTRKLAKFLGYPFSNEELENGVVQQILDLCSFENLKNLDVNKNGCCFQNTCNTAFFREGKVGDWKNHLSDAEIERLDTITEQKFKNTNGFTF